MVYWCGFGVKDWILFYDSELFKVFFGVVVVDGVGWLFVLCNEGFEGYCVLMCYDFEYYVFEFKLLVKVLGFDFDG